MQPQYSFQQYNMTDFRFEKQLGTQDMSFLAMKEKLQIIMETLQNEKHEFIKSYEKQLRIYQQQIRIKNNIIESLQQKLENSHMKLTQMEIQTSNYESLIDNLKRQIFKMASVVNNIANPPPTQELKRAKSDYLQNPFSKVDLSRDNMMSPHAKRFDINSYFQNVKHKYPLRKQLHSSRKIQEIEDNISNAETIKIKSEIFDSEVLRALKNNNERFKRTLKWGEQKSGRQQQNYLNIRDFKENLWQQTCR